MVKAVSTVPIWFSHNEMVAGTVLGLSLIALGTGGIKPCVCAFGGDQIPQDKVGCDAVLMTSKMMTQVLKKKSGKTLNIQINSSFKSPYNFVFPDCFLRYHYIEG